MMGRERRLLLYLVVIILFGCLLLFYSTYFTTREIPASTYYQERGQQKVTRSESDVPLPQVNVAINCSALCPPQVPKNILPITQEHTTSSPNATNNVTHVKKDKKDHLKKDHLKKDASLDSTALFRDSPLKWTKIQSTDTTIFSAYYEERKEMFGPSVVILGYQARAHDGESLYCLFQYSDGTLSCQGKSTFVEMDACNNQKEYHKKTLFKYKHVFHVCRLQDGGTKLPSKVALSSSSQCNPSSSLISIYSYKPNVKANIGVCVETPIFKKPLVDIINFIEMQRLFGAQVITLYLLDNSNQIESSLRKIYGNEGILDIIHWSTSFKEKDPLHYYGEILAIHDCLYRNLHRVNYLALLDLDEVIVSRRHSNWHEMLQELDSDYVDSFIFLNSVYLKTPEHNLPETTSHLKSLLCPGQMLPNYFTHYGKSKCRFHYYERSKVILKPLNVIDTDIHGPCRHRGDKTHFFVPDDMATSQHYREKPTIECKPNRKTKKYEVTYDDWLSRYGPIFMKSVQNRLCTS